VKCFTFPATPFTVRRERERQEEEAWKRSATVVAAPLEEEEDRQGIGTNESAAVQEIHRVERWQLYIDISPC
jgi:hypothetical protein